MGKSALAEKLDISIEDTENRLGIISLDRKWLNTEKFVESNPLSIV